ncbi:MAG: hypothetical protein HY986_06455 [Candidatus Melainabacteria bacterium]|nr:hypothetical protein [Candidatus Melainabacteria bacterium]
MIQITLIACPSIEPPRYRLTLLLLLICLNFTLPPAQGKAPAPVDLKSKLKRALAEGDADAAQKLLADPQAKQLRQADRLKYLYEVSAMKGDNKAAISTLNKLMALEPGKGEYLFRRAALYRGEKQYEKALDDYDTILALKAGRSPWALIERAAVFQAQGKNQQALMDLTEASAYKHVQFEAWREACNLCIKMGKHKEAVSFADKIIKQSPGDATFYLIRAREYAKMNNLAAASKDLRTAESIAPEDRAEINLVRKELLRELPAAGK